MGISSLYPIVIALESDARVLRSIYISGELIECITWTCSDPVGTVDSGGVLFLSLRI